MKPTKPEGPALPESPADLCILIHAPAGRVAASVQRMLEGAGLVSRACADLAALTRAAEAGAGAILVADEALTARAVRALRSLVKRQPYWSDLPIVLLGRRGDRSPLLLRAEGLGNVTFVERPVRLSALLGVLRVALRARRRQYALRGRVGADSLLGSIVNSTDDAIVSRDLDGTITSWNAGAERLFGYTAEEAIGKPMAMLLLPHRVEEEAEILERIRRGERFESREAVRVRKDGSLVQVSLTVSPIVDAHGRILGASKIARDISGRKQAEAALRDSENRLHLLLEQLPVGVGGFGKDGRWILQNRVLRQYVDDWIPSRSPHALERWAVFGPEGQALPLRDWPGERSLSGQPVRAPIEMVHVTESGRRVWMLAGSEILRDERGDIIGGMMVLQDIDARKRAEIALRESEERFRSLVSVLTDVPWTAVAAGDFRAPQPAWSEYTGQSDAELAGFGWIDAFHPDDRGRLTAAWKEAREKGEVPEMEGRLWNARTREFRHCLVRATAVANADGTVREWVGTCTDVHERRQAEEARHEADRRKNEFLATLAHELRNPLAPIRNVLEILGLGGQHDPQVEYVREVLERQVRHLTRLVEDLTEVSRITQGKVELRRARLELEEVLRTAIETAQPALAAARQRLALQLADEPLAIDGDAVRLGQVFANLLHNASRYSDPESLIDVAVAREGESAVIRIRDSGIGIPDEMLPRVFDMFTQVVDPSRRTHGGLGIGLTLVKNFVELHGGTVTASSEGAGRGSEFTVRLPLASGPADAPEPVAVRSLALPPVRVLVVDDNVDAAESTGLLLQVLGANVSVVHDGPAALARMTEFAPAIVLLDLGLPGMDGHQVAMQIRANPEWKDVKLVALTGWGQDEDRRATEAAGFDHHLVKPASVESLRTLILGVVPSPASPDASREAVGGTT